MLFMSNDLPALVDDLSQCVLLFDREGAHTNVYGRNAYVANAV